MAGGEITNEQSNITQENNFAQAGMNLDQSVAQIPKGKLTYALNAALENYDASSVFYQNEPGNDFCLEFPEDFHLIGSHFIAEQNKHIFFLTNPETGASQIGYMDNNDCVYRIYVDAPCLNFKIQYPIHKIVHKITNCTTEIYWTDGLNSRRYLDLQKIPYITVPSSDVCNPTPTKELDCNQLKIQPNFSIPSLDIVDVLNGGNLIAGTYQFAIQYSNATGVGYTSYYSVTNPTPIADPHVSTLNFNYPVGKSIVVDIANLDLTGYFTYFNLAVIKTINNIPSVELIGTYFIDRAAKQITYTGQNQELIKLTINDIFEKYPYYDIAQDLTTVQDVLIWDQLSSIDRINYQQIASQITLGWESWRIPSTESYADELNATNLRGYLRDEVYPFEIVFLLKNGKQTDGFHIPGRAISYDELTHPDVPSTNPDFIGKGTSAPYWKIYNTGSVSGYSPEYIACPNKSTYKGPYQYGEFAYWESLEVYPCLTTVWGDLANKPIRHHKFPDVLVSPIFETPTIELNGDGSYKNLAIQRDAIYPIGVKIDTNQVSQLIAVSNLTKEQKSQIAGFKIVRGDRGTNKSIVAKGILRNVGKYEREGTSYYYPNYPYNDLREDPFLLRENNAYNSQCNIYKIDVTSAGTIEYTDCTTGLVKTMRVPVGIFESICSLSLPTVVIGSGAVVTFTLCPFDTYQLTSASSTQFSYIGPIAPFKSTPAIPTVVTVTSAAPLLINVAKNNPPTYSSGNTDFTFNKLSQNVNLTCYPGQLNGFTYDENGYRQIFNSPETSFGQPFLGNILKLENVLFGAGKAHFVEVKKHAFYKLLSREAQQDALDTSSNLGAITNPFSITSMFAAYQAYLTIYINGITRRNFAYSYNSIASYDYSAPIENNLGIKQRELDIHQYIIPGVQSVGDNLNINNYDRESSVFLKTVSSKAVLPSPDKTPSLVLTSGNSAVTDNSRTTVSLQQNCTEPAKEFPINVVSYYGSIKNNIVNQWGQIYSYTTIDTGFQKIFGTENTTRGVCTVGNNGGSSTTTTTSSTTTITPTVCVIGVELNVTDISVAPYLTYLLCDGTLRTIGATLGFMQITECIQKFSISGAAFDYTYQGTICSTTTTTTTATPTTTTTTSSTTTIFNPNLTSTVRTIFGGDTFIGKFAFKSKVPFFIDNRVNAPDDSDVFYDELGNVAYPKYWFSARSITSDYSIPISIPTLSSNILTNIISIKAHNFDCPNNQNPKPNSAATPPVVNINRTYYDGKIYLFAYGIPYFYCESSINIDLRQAFNNREGDFYPNVSSNIPDDWVQESYVPIAQDNTYYYNVTFSKQNKENYFSHLPADWTEDICITTYPFRAIYSDAQQNTPDVRVNNWLSYQAISFFDFPQNFGKLNSLDGIQNKAVLARFENKSLLYNTMLTINTSNPQAAYLGNDTLFRSAPPIDFAETDLGYVGSQNKFLLKIPQGQITVDAKRGQVFLISGNQAQDISAFGSGMNRFFTDHLAFEILRYYPDTYVTINGKRTIIPGVDIDNHFNGIGLHGVYDSKYDRVIISKLDYVPHNEKIVFYDAAIKEFYINQKFGDITVKTIVKVTDPEYFCNKSWTLSYHMNIQSWVSFHSYIPNWYIAENNFFYSGINGGCNLELIAFEEVPTPSTTTTSTTFPRPEPTTTSTTTTVDCRLVGTADDCTIAGVAAIIYPPTTTTTTSSTSSTTTSSTTTLVPPTTTTTTTIVVPTTTSTTTTVVPTTTTTTTTVIVPTTTTTTTIVPTTTTTTTTQSPTTTSTTTTATPTTTSTTSSTSTTTSTTSTTTTSTPTTTSTTTTGVPCVIDVEIDITDVSVYPYLDYYLCDGTLKRIYVSTGYDQIPDCIQKGSIVGAGFNYISQGIPCTTPTTTTSTTIT